MRYEILDPRRIHKPHGRTIPWRCSLTTHMRFRDLLFERVDLENEPPTPETQARMAMLEEEIRSLPDFPRDFHPDLDTIEPVTTSAMR